MAIAILSCLALLAPLGASAASVANGNFETGSLSGWQTYGANLLSGTMNGWSVYSGTKSPISGHTIQSPPQGTFAATSDQNDPALDILYQDITLEPYYTHQLSLIAYYHSEAPIEVSTPDTLNPSGGTSTTTVEQSDQQFRIDVMKPSAPITSLAPGDILTTLFANKTGDSTTMAPTQLSADLTPFAGQTVRLRIAEVDNKSFFNAGVDAVSITSTPPPNTFTLGKLQQNPKNGTGKLEATVPGQGVLSAVDAHAAATSSSAKKKPALFVKSATVTATTAGTELIPLKPTTSGRKILKLKHKLKIKVQVSFTPTGGTASTQTFSGVLRLKAKSHH